MLQQHVDAFRHLGGGRKGLFVVLRYVFITTAAYLIVFQNADQTIGLGPALIIALALASNVALSLTSAEYLLAWYVTASILLTDTIWVSWALHQTGASVQDLFALYAFVLFLATVGERPLLAILGGTVMSAANLHLPAGSSLLTSHNLLQLVFLYAVALFYGHVMGQVKHERRRADRGFAWARHLEAIVEERTRELRRLYDESIEANRLKNEFVASISHDLRTPLNVIVGYADVLLESEDLGQYERTQLVRRVRHAAVSLKQLVDRLLDLGKLETGRVPVERVPLPLGPWMAEMRERERIPLAPGVRLDWRAPAGLPTIETDEPKLRSVLDNLVNNAIKFTVRGSITVSLEVLPAANGVQLTVGDTGPGIPSAEIPRILEPFHQGEPAPNGAHHGVGLGLAIVDRYVALLGGKLEVRSRVGVGTTFLVSLPLARHERASFATSPYRAA
jgi:signal transduction histidine kinase